MKYEIVIILLKITLHRKVILRFKYNVKNINTRFRFKLWAVLITRKHKTNIQLSEVLRPKH